MSRTPFVITLIVSALLVGWVYASGDDAPVEKKKPVERVEKARPADAAKPPHVYGFPDPRGIQLELTRRTANSCEGTRFRIQSPEFALWDDGTVVYRTPTYDYKRGKVPARKSKEWLATFRTPDYQRGEGGCKDFYARTGGHDWTCLRGPGGRGEVSMDFYGLAHFAGAHADTCAPCRPFRPLAGLVEEISAWHADQDEVLTGLPVEVYLQYRSCGCRNHPDIVAVSKAWPIPGPKPSDLCGRTSARLRLEDPRQIEALGQALSRSAAVLDGEEIYTCFMRPILDLGKRDIGPLASK